MNNRSSPPCISVIIPVYNAERTIASALNSVLQQTIQDIEVLVFDDGSADSSLSLVQGLARSDSRIAVHDVPHQGYTPLLNRGLALARGEFVARMDADDICEPTRFERQIELLRSREELVAVGSAITIIDADGDPFTVQHPPKDHEEIDRRNLRGDGGNLPHPTLMARTSALRAIGGYRPDFEPAEDLDLMLRLAEFGKLANLSEPLLRYRVHSQMVSVVKRDKQEAAIPRILAEAHARRGLTPVATPLKPEVDRDDSPKRRCLQSFHAGFYHSAQKYAARNCRAHPWNWDAWALLARMSYVRTRRGDGMI